jgi:hypothetical protein
MRVRDELQQPWQASAATGAAAEGPGMRESQPRTLSFYAKPCRSAICTDLPSMNMRLPIQSIRVRPLPCHLLLSSVTS